MRSLLEGYYGTGGEAGALAGPESSAAKNDINSKGFEAESYMSTMVRFGPGHLWKCRPVSSSSPATRIRRISFWLADSHGIPPFSSDSRLLVQLRTSKMEDLLHQHVSWAAEIKNLDSDMQMLVYENYSKFISATDTIRK